MSWTYQVMGEEHGPVSAKELKAAAEGGIVSPDTLVRKVGLDDWVTADRIKGLFNAPTSESKPTVPIDARMTQLPQHKRGIFSRLARGCSRFAETFVSSMSQEALAGESPDEIVPQGTIGKRQERECSYCGSRS